MDDSSEAIQDMMKGEFDGMDGMLASAIPPFTDYVKQQRKRLGGNMSIAWAISKRKQREQARKLLGDDVVFLVLNMTKECQNKRIEARHAGAGHLDMMMKIFDLYEPAGRSLDVNFLQNFLSNFPTHFCYQRWQRQLRSKNGVVRSKILYHTITLALNLISSLPQFSSLHTFVKPG